MSAFQNFWRDAELPQVELRRVEDGRHIGYAPHTHQQWSMGAILHGSSDFICGNHQQQVKAGSLVFINPNQVHACNPLPNQPWRYLMFYIDSTWLSDWCHNQGFFPKPLWKDLPCQHSDHPELFRRVVQLGEQLMQTSLSASLRQQQLEQCLEQLLPHLLQVKPSVKESSNPLPSGLQQLNDWLLEHYQDLVSLDDLCHISGYSSGHLIRLFRKHYGLTPHAWLLDRRIRFGQEQLKQGRPLAEVAQNAGFSDQAHFQRVFKRHVATTPGHYSLNSINQQINTTGNQQQRQQTVNLLK